MRILEEKRTEDEYSIRYNTKHQSPNNNQHTPQPSTPIKHAGSKVGRMSLGEEERKQESINRRREERGR